ncbi:MAG TPA: STAS domain-containing protein [Pyrinomonadaceae bacterium]|nr:STAS domain-containing protein [Pyrinomonadaceae bacterium]
MSKIEISERREGVVTVLDLRGELRLGQGNIDLHRVLRTLVDRGDRRIIINLADVTHIDSSGLGELVAGYTTLEKNHGTLKLLKLTERVRELMVITKLLTVFDAYDDESEALASFGFDEHASEVVTGPLDNVSSATGVAK